MACHKALCWVSTVVLINACFMTKNDLWKIKKVCYIYNNPFLATAGDMTSLICYVEAVKLKLCLLANHAYSKQ